MKNKSVAFLAAGVVLLAASCATAPRTATLTIELFDSKAVRAPELQSAAPLLLLPNLPPTRTAKLATSASSPAIDAGLLVPIRPSGQAALSLVAPAMPPLSDPLEASAKQAPVRQASTAPSAPVVPRGKQVAALPAPPVPSTPSAAVKPAAPAGSAASASGSPTGNAAAASTAPSGTYGRLREIFARQGDVLQVGLDGTGFLFLGLPDRQSDGMSFRSKENRNNKTWFTFQAVKLGTYDLDFLQQDNAAGKTTRETVRVHVVSDQDFNAAVASQSGSGEGASDPASAEAGDPVFAQKLAALGSYQAAVAELLKGYRDGNPGLNDQIAGLYLRMGSYEAAGKYYDKNLTPQGPFTPSAVVGLVRIAVLQNDQQELVSFLRQFLALKDPSMEEPLVQAVRMEKARSEIGMALDLASEYVKRFPDGTWRDEIDYLSAQLLEADSQFRDIARARDLYNGILTGRPESVFAEPARQRLRYIERHFFQVR